MSAEQRRRARSRAQFSLLVGLWWRHIRRQPRRLGDLPNQSGLPSFLLINLISLGYLVPLAFAVIKVSIEGNVGRFAWHALGVVATALGAGLSSRTFAPQGRARNDLFLEALPLAMSPRLGLALLDGYPALLLAFVVPLASTLALGGSSGHQVPVVLFGGLLFLSVFLAGCALRAWLRVLGPPATARVTGYVGSGLTLAGFGLAYFPVLRSFSPGSVAHTIAEAWLVDGARLGALYAAAALLGMCAYGALMRAERRGFDRIDLAASAPRQRKGLRSRHALEALLVWRQGGRLLLITFSALLLFTLLSTFVSGHEQLAGKLPDEAGYFMFMGMVVYLGSIQAIGLAGRSARSDLVARPFLSALPLAPHQVLDGKTAVLRWLSVPVFLALAFVIVVTLRDGLPEISLRALLAAVALYALVAGAVAVAFLSSGVGVPGVAGGQMGSSFSTQLLLLPMMMTVFARDNVAACVSLIAVVAVTREALRAARLSVRWIDDSDQDTERETSVWRALLAATVFFSTQRFAGGVLTVFGLRGAYAMAVGFAFACGMLVLLTVRNRERFARPHIAPRQPWYMPIGLLAGALSGRLAVWAFEIQTGAAEGPEQASMGETAALLVTLVLVAPLAEEYFFRGWLQKAIEQDLPRQHKRWAFALGAVAFALAHVGTYGLPQLVVGLIAGALYANGGGLASAMLTHAAHNAIVMYFGFSR